MNNVLDQYHEDEWSLYNADSVEVLENFEDNSIDLSVYSPPFASLYTYSPTARDLGNSKSTEDFLHHYSYIIKQLLRIHKPGRVTAVHVADIAATLANDGYIGVKDFSGDVIRAYVKEGWVFDARIPIDKNQQIAAIRTHSKHLTMTQMEKDRTWLAPSLPDYILKFRKPGDNEIPVNGKLTPGEWIEYANPVWPEDDLIARGIYIKGELDGIKSHLVETLSDGKRVLKPELTHSEILDFYAEIEKMEEKMNLPFASDDFYPLDGIDRCADCGAFETWYHIEETDVIQGWKDGREEKDERHICPLQLETIRRCVELWSNEGEIVLDPFVGVGSVVYMAAKLGRKAIGIELKESWYRQAIINVNRVYGMENASLY